MGRRRFLAPLILVPRRPVFPDLTRHDDVAGPHPHHIGRPAVAVAHDLDHGGDRPGKMREGCFDALPFDRPHARTFAGATASSLKAGNRVQGNDDAHGNHLHARRPPESPADAMHPGVDGRPRKSLVDERVAESSQTQGAEIDGEVSSRTGSEADE